MKLKEFRVKEFRSVWDSGAIEVDERITCLVGKNESGKTALLQALYKTNPIIPNHAVFDSVYDYPKSEVEDYRFAVENKERAPVLVVDSVYQLENEDKVAVQEVFGPHVLTESYFRHCTIYGKKTAFFSMQADDLAARKHLATKLHVSKDIEERLTSAQNWKGFLGVLDDIEATSAVKECKILVKTITENLDLAHHIVTEILWPRAPKYLYFDEYYQMKGQENLNALVLTSTVDLHK